MAPEVEAILQRALDTIEENLRAEISIQELSEQAGFSLSRFYRLFETATGLSVKRYITRRKLLHAICDMHNGTDAIDAALNYGFQTHAGFYKAFVREFGCAPSRYLRTHRASRPSRPCLKEETPVLSSKEIAAALENWGLEKETTGNIYYRNTGHRSEHTCSVGETYVLKYSASLGELHRQAQLQLALSKHACASAPIPAKSGELVVRVGDVDFLLMERAEGTPVDAVQIMKQPEAAEAIGAGLARLHMALGECEASLACEEDLVKTLREWAVPAAKQAMPPDRAWLDRLLNRLEENVPRLSRQIIHRDPNPDNLLMKNGQVVCFLDFQLSRILPRIFDLAYAATGILSSSFSMLKPQERHTFFEAAHALWRGYHHQSPLSKAEQEMLPDMVIAIQLICVAAFSNTQKYAELARINQEMLRLIMKNEETLRAYRL